MGSMARLYYRDDSEDCHPVETERARCSKCGRFFVKESLDSFSMTPNRETKCTPCARPWSMDSRDKRPDPPAILDPMSVLRNRERTQKFLATGAYTWPRPEAA